MQCIHGSWDPHMMIMHDGDYQAVTGLGQAATCHYQVIIGNYQAVIGHYQIIAGHYQVLTGQYQVVTGHHPVATVRCPAGTGHTKPKFWSRNESPWLRLGRNITRINFTDAPCCFKPLPEPHGPIFEPTSKI